LSSLRTQANAERLRASQILRDLLSATLALRKTKGFAKPAKLRFAWNCESCKRSLLDVFIKRAGGAWTRWLRECEFEVKVRLQVFRLGRTVRWGKIPPRI